MTSQGLGLKKLTGNAAMTLCRQLTAAVLQLSSAVIIARMLGPDGNGKYAIALLLSNMLANLLNLGIGPANVYYLGSGKVDVTTAFQATKRLTLLIVAAGLGLGSLSILFFSKKWFPNVPVAILWGALFIFPFTLSQSFLSSFFQGLQEFKRFNLILLLQPVILLMLVLTLIPLCRLHIAYIIATQLIASMVTVFVGLIYIRKKIDKNMRVGCTEKGYTSKVLTYGYKAHISNILTFINYKADIFLVNLLINPAAAGIYVVAVQIVERLWLLSQSVSTVILPRLSELSINDEHRKQLTPVICRTVLMVTLVGALVLACFTYPFITIFYGKAYKKAIVLLLILLPGIVVGSGSRIMANDIAARGHPELNMYFSFIVVLVNIVGNIFLIPKFGLAGAALATSIAYGLNLLLRLIVYKRISGNSLISPLLMTRDDFTRFKKLFATPQTTGH